MTADAAASRLFVYGTLMMPAVLKAVCDMPFTPRAATLPDYARYQLRERVYPAIVPAVGAITAGLLCEGLDERLWRRLDRWESELYTRHTVTVRDAAGALFDAQTYVLAPAHRHLLSTAPWSPDAFERLHLADYLARWTRART